MIIYLSAIIERLKDPELFKEIPAVLLSYLEVKDKDESFWEALKSKKVFLDSGAFSAFTQGTVINIQEYADYVKKYDKYLTTYANLDVIGNAEKTLKNQEYLEKQGLKPLPAYHLGENFDVYKRMLENYDYIGLGGVAPKNISFKLKKSWLYQCFNVKPSRTKIHGFGITRMNLLKNLDFYSVDSTSWLVYGIMRYFNNYDCFKHDFKSIRVHEDVSNQNIHEWNEISEDYK